VFEAGTASIVARSRMLHRRWSWLAIVALAWVPPMEGPTWLILGNNPAIRISFACSHHPPGTNGARTCGLNIAMYARTDGLFGRAHAQVDVVANLPGKPEEAVRSGRTSPPTIWSEILIRGLVRLWWDSDRRVESDDPGHWLPNWASAPCHKPCLSAAMRFCPLAAM
jgi:hypothetical protein